MARFPRRKKKSNKTFNPMNKSNKDQSKQISINTRNINIMKKDPERKVVLQSRVFATSGIGVLQSALNPLTQGVSDENRIGDSIRLRFLEFNYYATTQSAACTFRMFLFIDHQNNQSNTTILPSILLNHTPTNIASIISTFNEDYVGPKKRIRILYDTGAVTLGTVSQQYKTIRLRIPLSNKVQYQGNVGTAEDIIDNCVAVYVISNDAACVYGWQSKLTFIDS